VQITLKLNRRLPWVLFSMPATVTAHSMAMLIALSTTMLMMVCAKQTRLKGVKEMDGRVTS
jgi:hypothetical protein